MARIGGREEAEGADRRESSAVAKALVAVAAGVGNNYCFKALAALPAGEIAALRSAGLLLVLAPLYVALRRRPRLTAAVLVRAVFEATATLLLIVALGSLPLTLVATVTMTVPIGVAAVGVFLAGEPVSRIGAAAIALGFAGAAIAIGPTLSADPLGLAAAIGSALAYVARDVITRTRVRTAPSLDLAFVAGAVTLAGALALAPFEVWRAPAPGELVLVAAAILLFVLANLLIVAAVRDGRLAIVGATRYSSVLWAIAIDGAVFGIAPPPAAVAGAAIIVAAGLVLVADGRIPRRPSAP